MQTETEVNPGSSTPNVSQPATGRTSHVAATAPGQIRVIKRNGTVVPYDESKIAIAMTKAFLAVEGGTAAASSRIRETVASLAEQISATFTRRMPSGGTIHIEDIQDQVELAMMRSGEHKVARDYVLYREEHARLRAAKAATVENPEPDAEFGTIMVAMPDGSQQALNMVRVRTLVEEACAGLAEVDPEEILKGAMRNLYNGVSLDDVNTSLVITARTLVEKEPNYTHATARLLLDKLRSEALTFLGVTQQATHQEMAHYYAQALPAYIKAGIELDLLDPELASFDLDMLGQALDHSRDDQFTYLGLQTLYDRYFIHSNDVRIELPQVFFMRVAMGLSVREENRNERAVEFYRLLSSFDYMSSTPTLFNSGTLRPQLSSCYLTTIPDDLHGIYGAIQDNAMLSKFAGGLGNDWTPVRSLGAYIKGTNGKSQGVVPFLESCQRHCRCR